MFGKGTPMPNPKEYKSVGLTSDAYDKLKYVAEQEDRPLGRQLSRLIDLAYQQIQNAKRGYRPTNVGGIGGAAAVSVMELED
tara:strand:+ start:445 stop:690 length:246 start_codon:yes stop_codon:yes gene_type:complete